MHTARIDPQASESENELRRSIVTVHQTTRRDRDCLRRPCEAFTTRRHNLAPLHTGIRRLSVALRVAARARWWRQRFCFGERQRTGWRQGVI